MKQKAIDCGMTTEPTVSQALSADAFILLDMRTAEGSKAALGGTYPATSLYMQTYVNNKDTVQKLVNAYVTTLKWIQAHTAARDRRPDARGLLQGRRQGRLRRGARQREGHLQPDRPHAGRRAAHLPGRARRVTGKGKSIDLAKTYTDEFVKKALSTLPSPAASS